MRNSTFSGNLATVDGGEVHSSAGSTSQTLQNSTFVNNSASVASAVTTGAGINQWDYLTIVDNVGSAALDVYETLLTMRNSIIARNTADDALTGLGNGTGTFLPEEHEQLRRRHGVDRSQARIGQSAHHERRCHAARLHAGGVDGGTEFLEEQAAP